MTTSLWPIHPHPLPDELLSSWLIRLARGNGYKVHSFCAQFFGRERQIWNRDIDHLAPAWLLDALASRSGTTPERIVKTTLRAFESFAFERFCETGTTRWVLPLSVFHRTRRARGQQFCPLCLAGDAEPYLRRSWRLAVSVVCVAHEVSLQDACPHCSSPIAPHRSDIQVRTGLRGMTSMLRCFNCRGRLDGAVALASAEDVRVQKKIDNAVRDGYVEAVPGRLVYSPLYFDGLRLIMRAVDIPGSARHRRGFEFETLEMRLKLLRSAVDLTENWPRNFVDRCATMSHPFTTIANKMQRPYWVDEVLREHVFQRRAVISHAEAAAIVAAALRRDPAAPLVELARQLSGRDIGRLIRPLPPVSDDSSDLLIAYLDQVISTASPSSRWLLIRDKVMFIAGRSLRLNMPRLLELELNDMEPIGEDEFSFWQRVDTQDRTFAMLRWYAREVRPKLISGDSKALFVGVGGMPIKRNAIGMRFSAAVANAQLDRAIPDWTRWARLTRDSGVCPSFCANDSGFS